MLLKNATIATFDPPEVSRGDLRIDAGRVVDRRESLSPSTRERVVDLTGRLVVPGLVNAHTHLYSVLARGMPGPKRAPRRFIEILKRVWWRLDRALDQEAIRLSALVGGIEAALSGTTLLIDHHSSPGFIDGSLATIKDSLERVGLRSVLCYETSDRNGVRGRDAGLHENATFHHDGLSEYTRGMIGAHASFTLSDETLEQLAAAVKKTGTSLHIHVAEDKLDVDECRSRYDCGLPERLQQHGLLKARTLLAHCVHLTAAEINKCHTSGGWIAHNPRSNMNNNVGTAPASELKRAALGTDGMDEDLWAEARAAYLKMREGGRSDAADATLRLLAGGHRLAAALFGLPFGKLDAGAPADLVILDYFSPTPLHAENLAGHLLFGVDRGHVRSVMVAGRWIVRQRRVVNVDNAAVYARARGVAEAVWERMQKLS